ncbi:hypothetical protein KXX16_005723 [Aspergillus fumigatus]|uniref:Uncharacterized protein n=1 Tax=Aspergillus fumigatus TaxID=746128 RepID=A0A9P8N946_ASPFM|nr:hypothetical protein CNMCM8714_006169 [Aspergillus fumigatus]KMK54994.1 hypothetical protein Y699_09340 [Aspergillus fumigatus Z5]KAH1289513.1 hypothetical protein KXX11_001186 [Aspergillus fumigatus]KAH1336846.1 hypothetical protein KXX67_002467 [Aspergillus fumigatus]KAH1340157.1 hypothetical protein KXX33_005265 [Aspergillus fumigatus]
MDHQYHSLYSIAEEITPQDHEILLHGGTSSNIERLPSRLQMKKTQHPRSMKKQIEDLAYEVSYLKAEVAWHAESKRALLQLQEQMYHLFYKMEDALVKVNTRLQEAEQRYLSLWGIKGRVKSEEEMI